MLEKYAPYIKGLVNGLGMMCIIWVVASLPSVSEDAKVILMGLLFSIVAIRDKLNELKND